MQLPASLCVALLSVSTALGATTPKERPPLEKGTFRFTPGDEANVPKRYRLEAGTYDYQMSLKYDLPNSGVRVLRLRYPSPVKSPHPENNTVHAEYYRPHGKGPFPAVIVLDITGGDQSLSRRISTYLAQKRIAALFVQMAYYGPRRPPKGNVRLLSTNFPRTMAAVRQTVLDLRVATAWLASRPEVDAKRLGILGTSLGSFIATLTAEMEPRLARLAVLLGGGGFVDAYYDHPKAKDARKVYEALGGTKEQLKKLVAPAEPLTCAANLKDRKVLILAGKRDDIVPPKMAEALWRATGKQKIVWFDCTHYGAIVHILAALEHVRAHFQAP